MHSTSSTGMSSSRDGACPPVLSVFDCIVSSTRIPSTNRRGCCVRMIPLGPRSRTRDPAPATPLEAITLTPGRRAVSASDSVRWKNGASAAESMTPTDAPVERSDAAAEHEARLGCCAPAPRVKPNSTSASVMERVSMGGNYALGGGHNIYGGAAPSPRFVRGTDCVRSAPRTSCVRGGDRRVVSSPHESPRADRPDARASSLSPIPAGGARVAMRSQSEIFTPCLRSIPQARSLDTLAAPAGSSPIHRADRGANRHAALARAGRDHTVCGARANAA